MSDLVGNPEDRFSQNEAQILPSSPASNSTTDKFLPWVIALFDCYAGQLSSFFSSISPGPMDQLSRVVRKPAFCIWENKDANQLHGNRKADQHLCFCYIDSTIPQLSKS